jgi:short-subunit dehydrogenase
MELQGATVLLTGASRGIGRELARHFASAGATPVLVARDEAALEQAAAETHGHALPADLSDRDQVGELWRRAEQLAGPVQVLVNNAAVAPAGDVTEVAWQDVETALQVDLLAPMRLCRDAASAMRAGSGGHIVNVSSLAGVATVPGLAAYSASKAALSHFTGVLRTELCGLPIGTTLVELGPVPTELLRQLTQHGPTDGAFRRLYGLRLAVDVPASTVAAAVVDAVRHGRRHVRLPRRAAAFAILAEAPRSVSRLVLHGVPRRP